MKKKYNKEQVILMIKEQLNEELDNMLDAYKKTCEELKEEEKLECFLIQMNNIAYITAFVHHLINRFENE